MQGLGAALVGSWRALTLALSEAEASKGNGPRQGWLSKDSSQVVPTKGLQSYYSSTAAPDDPADRASGFSPTALFS